MIRSLSRASTQANCPECRGPLAFGADGTAHCTLHGGEYKVLFRRQPLADADAEAAAMGAGGLQESAAPPPELFCVQHPKVPATHHCYSCFDGVCDTCDFAFPDGRHFCPRCATDPQPKMSDQRKRRRNWSMGLAGFTTAWWVAFFGIVSLGGFSDKDEALGGFFALFALILPIVGLTQALSATDKRLANPLSLRLAAIWNGLLLGAFVLLMIAGIARSGK